MNHAGSGIASAVTPSVAYSPLQHVIENGKAHPPDLTSRITGLELNITAQHGFHTYCAPMKTVQQWHPREQCSLADER